MNRLWYWIGILASAGIAGAIIWWQEPSKSLFPGLMTLFSFYLIWIAQDSRLRKENPKILVYRGSRGLLSRDTEHQFVVCVSNPGVLAGTLTKIDYWIKEKLVCHVDWSWQSLHPALTPRPNEVVPISNLPAPLLPGGLIAVFTTTKIDPVPNDAYLYLTFKIGGYKERTMKWRVEPLKTAGKAEEEKA